MIAFARIAQGIDAAPKCEEGFVDVSTFDESLSAIFCGAGSLATGKIDDAESCHGVWLVDICISILL